MARKPRELVAGRIYPLVQVYENRIWMQNSFKGKWTKVPLKRAAYIADRLNRAVRYVTKKKAA